MGAWIETSVKKEIGIFRQSHPVWVRGLKLRIRNNTGNEKGVAPRVGAWIETLQFPPMHFAFAVAPRVGAWIETCISCVLQGFNPSHPVWVRGLKLFIVSHSVLPRTSHPVWVRGLKHAVI